MPPGVPLACELRRGALSFEASVVDISVRGLGGLIYDLNIRIEPGARFDARIRHPRRAPILAEVEVRYVARVLRPDGRPANRAGCLILTADAELEELIKLFITALE